MSFSWPVALKQSALRRLSVLDGALLPTTEEIVGEIDPKGAWRQLNCPMELSHGIVPWDTIEPLTANPMEH